MQLGDIEALRKVQVCMGSVFKMVFYPRDGVKPKGHHANSRTKYFVVVGVDAEGNYVGVSLINSEVNIHFARQIAPFQWCIYPEKYDFLDGKFRYVDCYNIRDIETTRILQEAEYIGYLEEADLQKIRELLLKSPVNDLCKLKQYGLAK